MRLLFAPLLVAAAMALAACPGGIPGTGPAEPAVKTSTQAPVTGDASLGPADAGVVLTEYFAPTCPACKNWHDTVYPQIKERYIDTGKIRFEVREMPSHRPVVDRIIFGMARCVGADLYFPLIDSAFARWERIENAANSASGPEPQLLLLAQEFGMDRDKMLACAAKPELRERLLLVETERTQLGVTGTPTHFINGRMAQSDLATLSQQLDQTIAASQAAPAPEASPTATPTAR